jgi:hypothetical protein
VNLISSQAPSAGLGHLSVNKSIAYRSSCVNWAFPVGDQVRSTLTELDRHKTVTLEEIRYQRWPMVNGVTKLLIEKGVIFEFVIAQDFAGTSKP